MNKIIIDKYNMPLRNLSKIYNLFPDLYTILFSTEDRYIEIDLDEFPVLREIKLDAE